MIMFVVNWVQIWYICVIVSMSSVSFVITLSLSCQVRIREASGLPLNLSNFVFCQYSFWEQSEPAVAPPIISPDTPPAPTADAHFTVCFDHCRVNTFTRVPVLF